eukprot:TRINITY_DN2906_c0_g1_i1.p1 TRINITY_DN2906_c0_g1~~TRINITY_DN2906_c0_g1_i1.p1  ORF type:complete len:364 (-),score=130.38 TRINITY_DN2906_c0_g1_i1:123-1214(-)
MPLSIKIYAKNDFSGNFRQLSIEFNMTCAVVAQLVCAKYGMSEYTDSFALFEQWCTGGAVAERRIGESEVIANIVQTWQQSGCNNGEARFAFSVDEPMETALLARAKVLQAAGHVSAYGSTATPPDVSGLMNALDYYVGALDAETTAELLRSHADGSFVVRDGKQPDAICVSYVRYGSGVFHVRVKFDINGFFCDGMQQQRVLTVGEVLQQLVALAHPLRTPLAAHSVMTPRVLLSAQIRTFPCFYGRIGAARAEQLLRVHRNGTFIIRDSSRDGAFATSYVADQAVRHSLVLVADSGLSTPGDGRFYPTLDDFIDASRMMFFGLPRASASLDDGLLEALGVRESHENELTNGVLMASQRWVQ